MRLRISSDGTGSGTHVYGHDTNGEMQLIEGVQSIRWLAPSIGAPCYVEIVVNNVPLQAALTELAPGDLIVDDKGKPRTMRDAERLRTWQSILHNRGITLDSKKAAELLRQADSLYEPPQEDVPF